MRAIESLIARLESAEAQETRSPIPVMDTGGGPVQARDEHFVHSFDTESGDLQRCGYALELRERAGSFTLVAAKSGGNERGASTASAEVRIDGSWAAQILSGLTSPFAVLERRMGSQLSPPFGDVRAIVGAGRIHYGDMLVAGQAERGSLPTPAVPADPPAPPAAAPAGPRPVLVQPSRDVERRAMGK